VATASAFFASGRAEETVYFRGFGSKATKTTEKERHFLAAAGEKRPLRREQTYIVTEVLLRRGAPGAKNTGNF
jgi:16S rRNA C1402 (ribose-2'-O) methylase RsmI